MIDALITPQIQAALAEDWGRNGDITSTALIPTTLEKTGEVRARQPGVLCGTACARLAFALTDSALQVALCKQEGAVLEPGDVAMRIHGSARALLMAERVALNFLTHLSGIATLTHAYVAAVAGTGARITCTRKTVPGLRMLEKHAVRVGGGSNHRFGLDDAVLIKDNHIAAVGSVAEAIRRARVRIGHLVKIEVEVDNLTQLKEAIAAKPDVVMLDNFTLPLLGEAVAYIRQHAPPMIIEASGGVTLASVRAIAATGVDVISVGALTHSAPALDLGLDF